MTFWGVEVKPGKPFTLKYEDFGGKLILTQATLGTSSSLKKSTLQCNVGDSSPIFLCTLLPDKSESVSLNLEFEEDDDVMFSVVGPTSIHISGFVHRDQPESDDDGYEYDSSGEDMTVSESEEEDSDSDEEDSVDDFIDDDGMPMFAPSPARKSGVVIEEIVDDDKTATENGGTKQSKKKKKLADSGNDNKAQKQIVLKGDTGASVLESEDEDGFPVSSTSKSEPTSEKPEASTRRADEEGKKKKKKNDKNNDTEGAGSLKRKVDAIDHDEEPKSIDAANQDTSENKKKKKKKKAVKTENDEVVANLKQDASAEAKKLSDADKGAKQSNTKPAKARTFANGLVIEELEMGKPDGKRASRGSKVSVRYIGKLQKTGKQFDSNIGRAPFKFRLGVGQVIKGWDVGVEGMRVGDKRRLTIPPEMGYGRSGVPPQIPPNAWLVFDVELVNVA